MMDTINSNLSHMAASFLRAAVATISATQGFNLWSARGWQGTLEALGVALVPPLLVFLGATADLIDSKKG